MADSIAAPHQTELTRPVPPRCWWLKRIAAAVGGLLLATAGLRVWWGYEAERRLAACLAAYRAAGEPIAVENLAVPPAPDEENGALYLQRAARRIKKPAELTQREYEHVYDYDYWPASADALRQVVRANAEALALVRQAREQTRANWGYQLVSPTVRMMGSNPGDAHSVARLAIAAARCAHADGNDDAAVAYLRDVLGVGRHMRELEPRVWGYHAQQGVLDSAIDEVQRLAFELRVRGASEPAAPGSAAHAAVRELIADLLAEQPLRAAWVRAADGERLMALEYARLMNSPSGIFTIYGPRRGWARRTALQAEAVLLGPAHTLDALATLAEWTRIARAGVAADYQTARAQRGHEFWQYEPPAWALGILPHHAGPGVYADLRGHFRALARRRLAATALAVRLFELDHGVRPTELGDLVPDYLPTVPTDPFDPQTAALRYAPDRLPPAVYSVGENGRDDGGDSGRPNTVAGDEVFMLDELPPPRPRPWPPGY